MARSDLVTSGNERIAEDVRAELRADSAVPDHGIEVHVHHGTVDLRGSVPGLLQQHQALQDAHGVRGVRDVVDELGGRGARPWRRSPYACRGLNLLFDGFIDALRSGDDRLLVFTAAVVEAALMDVGRSSTSVK